MIQWSELSTESASILEFLENPFTGVKSTLRIKNGEVYKKFGYPVNVMITDKIFKEIKEYCNQEDDINIIDKGSELVIKLL